MNDWQLLYQALDDSCAETRILQTVKDRAGLSDHYWTLIGSFRGLGFWNGYGSSFLSLVPQGDSRRRLLKNQPCIVSLPRTVAISQSVP